MTLAYYGKKEDDAKEVDHKEVKQKDDSKGMFPLYESKKEETYSSALLNMLATVDKIAKV